MFLRPVCLAAVLSLSVSAYAETQKTDAELEGAFFVTAKAALEAAHTPATRTDADDEWKFRKAIANAVRGYDRGFQQTFALR